MKRVVLVVEDDQVILEIIHNFLVDNYIVKVAKNGKAGLEVYNRFKPEIIITDINMPKLNGIEMLKLIRKDDKNVKLIVLTAHSDVNFLLQATELKLTKYLIKPIEQNKLNEAINLAQKELSEYTMTYHKTVKHGSYSWKSDNLELLYKDEPIELTLVEKIFLEMMFKSIKKVFIYDEIFEYFWNKNYDFSKKNLKVLVSNLKKKLPENFIENVYAVGYKVKED